MNKHGHFLWSFLLLTLVAPVGFALADEADDAKPFAEVRVVLQLSDQARESVVLDVANNLIKNYGGPDNIDIEVITFGPGIRLLYAGSQHETRIASLVANGVRFYVCENTLDTMERNYGSRPTLSEHANPVRAGVARIVEKVRDGYILVRP
jgi:intracellular sulfur oxidation DsrE/DsrF family protein